MTPIGAICAATSAPSVVMMLSMIMASRSRLRTAPLLARLEGGAGRAMRGRWLRGIDRVAPAQILVLDVTLAELPGDLGPPQLDAEIEGVRAVILDAELGKQLEGVLRHAVLVAIVEMDAVGGDLDAEVAVADLRGSLRNLGGRAGIGPAVAQRHQAGIDADRKAPRSEEHTSELQSRLHLVCRLLLEKKKKYKISTHLEDT